MKDNTLYYIQPSGVMTDLYILSPHLNSVVMEYEDSKNVKTRRLFQLLHDYDSPSILDSCTMEYRPAELCSIKVDKKPVLHVSAPMVNLRYSGHTEVFIVNCSDIEKRVKEFENEIRSMKMDDGRYLMRELAFD